MARRSRGLACGAAPGDLLVVEATGVPGNHVERVFDGEVPGVKAMEFGAGQVAKIGLAKSPRQA
jgi:hypothetical protein